jgi:hypothetical protein
MGINLGPVRLVMDINGQPNVVGDGVNVAQRIMGFAESGQIVASRSYCEAVLRLLPQYAGMFHYRGSRTDRHVREHEIYVIAQPGDATVRQTAGEVIVQTVPDRHASAQRRVLYMGVFALVMVLIGVIALKLNRHDLSTALPEGDFKQAVSAQPKASLIINSPSPEKVVPDANTMQPAISSSVIDSVAESKKSVGNKIAGNNAAASDRQQSGQSRFGKAEPVGGRSSVAEKRGGTDAYISVICKNDEARVFVDFVQKGKANTGALTLAVPPGKHTVLVKHDSGLVHKQEIDLASGNTVSIRPKFCD